MTAPKFEWPEEEQWELEQQFTKLTESPFLMRKGNSKSQASQRLNPNAPPIPTFSLVNGHAAHRTPMSDTFELNATTTLPVHFLPPEMPLSSPQPQPARQLGSPRPTLPGSLAVCKLPTPRVAADVVVAVTTDSDYHFHLH
ncbi:hypothetical protein SprV_0602137300 [Sparganum proliferum]